MTARLSKTAIFLRIFCAAVLLSLGFAHKPVQAGLPLEALSEEYRLPDGTFAVLCVEGDHGEQHPTARPLCEVCLLSASTILPPPDDESWIALKRASLDNGFIDSASAFAARSVEQPKSRGPPLTI